MGLSFRKSIKLGKNIRLNFSKTGGIGISAGTKGARVSINKKGVRTTVGKGGLQYRKDYSFKKNKSIDKQSTIDSKPKEDTYYLKMNSPKMSIETTNKIFKWFAIGIISLIIGAAVFPPILLLSVFAILYSFKTMIFGKEYRSTLMSHLGIKAYEKGQHNKAMKYCKKALKIYSENGSAKNLINILEASK